MTWLRTFLMLPALLSIGVTVVYAVTLAASGGALVLTPAQAALMAGMLLLTCVLAVFGWVFWHWRP